MLVLGILQVPCIIGSTIVDHAKTKQILVVIESKKNQYWSDNVGSPKFIKRRSVQNPNHPLIASIACIFRIIEASQWQYVTVYGKVETALENSMNEELAQ